MRAASLLAAALSLVYANALAPLDLVAGLFGTPRLNDATAVPYHARPIEDVPHEECRMTLGGCEPAAGCRFSLGRCEPRIGHYWTVGEMSRPRSLLASLLPGVPPVMHFATAKGILASSPGFFTTSYYLLDEADEQASSFYALPGMITASWTAQYVALPGLALFLAVISMSR